jgi:hypothetical protein
MNILLIGNSQMGVCNLPQMLRLMSESAPDSHPRLNIGQVVTGGASLKSHWEAGVSPDSPRGKIAAGGWDKVVIQEIFNAEPSDFETYALKFDGLIREAGARAALFATANVTRYYNPAFDYPGSFERLNGMQLRLGKERGVTVAAGGFAWMRYWGTNPSDQQMLDLYHPDKGHPGKKGTYIYACLLYAVLTGESPSGLIRSFPDIPGGDISAEEAARMQKAAWNQFNADSPEGGLCQTTGNFYES